MLYKSRNVTITHSQCNVNQSVLCRTKLITPLYMFNKMMSNLKLNKNKYNSKKLLEIYQREVIFWLEF